MSFDNTIYALSNINAILGSTAGYINDKKSGTGTSDAIRNFGYNVMHGAFRNAASRDIQQYTGSYLGYAMNSIAGYGDPVANHKGSIGTMTVAMLSSPFGLFGCNPYLMTSSLYGCGPMGGGYFYNGFFPGRCNSFGLGIPSLFSPMGFYC